MQATEVTIENLTPYENNPRRNEDAVAAVANSIKEFGFKVPIVIDAGGTIVAGHTRVEAAKRLGMKTVPAIVADDLTPEQIRAFRIADNKVAEKATWDLDKLRKELETIEELFDFTGFGFNPYELDAVEYDYEPEGFDEVLIDEYSENENDYLARRRVIIKYEPEEAEALAQLLGLETIDKVTYRIEEL